MRVLGIGIDVVETARIRSSLDRYGERFLHRVFTAGEIEYCSRAKCPEQQFGARFAAKEAVSKAFGTGIGDAMGWKDIEVVRQPSGEPSVVLHGGAAELAAARHVLEVKVSLTHTRHYAAANAVVLCEG